MKAEEQRSSQSSELTKSDTQDEQSNPRVEEWLGKSMTIVGSSPAVKAGGPRRTTIQVERQLSSESSGTAKTEGKQSNPFSDSCFVDNTQEMMGRSIAIVGASPPQKRS